MGNLIAFRVGYTDAEILAAEFANEFNPSTFVDLPRFHALAKVQEGGEPQPSFKARLMEPLNLKSGKHERHIAKSRERFASKRQNVERKINRWLMRN